MDAEERDLSATRQVLTEDECWQLLASASLGRLAMSVSGEVEIFPVNHMVKDRAVYFRSAEGTKLIEVIIAGDVAYESDGIEPDRSSAWSVVVKGPAEVLDRFDDVYQAQDLGIRSWTDSAKERFVRIRPTSITGRRYAAGEDAPSG